MNPSNQPTRSPRYHKLTGNSVTEGATLAADGFGFVGATAAEIAEMSASRHKLRAETTSLAMMVVNQVLPLSGLGSSGGEGTGSLLFLLDRPSKQEDEQAFPSVLVGHSVRE